MDRLLAGLWGPGPALLLEYVFLEVVTVLRARRGLETAISVATLLLQASEIRFVPCSDIFADTLRTFQDQRGRALSFTDAAIVAVARSQGVPVVTFDDNFRGLERIAVIPD